MSDYAKEKFYEALLALVGSSTLEERLTYAAINLLMLQEKQVPEDMRADFVALRNALTKEPLSTATGYVPRRVSQEEARELAHKIVSMYTELMGGL